MPDEVTEPTNLPDAPPPEAATPATAYPTVEELAALLPQYEIHRVIGIGGMGAVYLGRQMALDRWVAIKLLPVSAAQHAGATESFIKEARAMARLVHPHIVAVFDFGQTVDGHLYLVMEYVEGDDLHRRTRAGEITQERARRIVVQLCNALQFAHDHGVAHRDIKPANILIGKDWQVKVADFGLARELAAVPNADEPEYGTPDYTAPERLIAGATVDHRADIYALGVVMHEMLTGKTPRSAGAEAGKKLPDAFAGVISKCLMHDPARRFQTATEVKMALLTALSAAAADKPAASAGAPSPGPAPIESRPQEPAMIRVLRSLGPVGWGLASVVLLGVLGWAVVRNLQPTDPGLEPAIVRHDDRAGAGDLAVVAPPKAAEPSPAAESLPAPAQSPVMPAAPAAPEPPPAIAAAMAPAAVTEPMVRPPEQPLGTIYQMPDGGAGEVVRLSGHTGNVTGVSILPDQRRIVSVSLDGTLRVWDAATAQPLVEADAGIGDLGAVSITPDGSRAVVASLLTDKLAIIDLNNGKRLAEAAAPNTRLIRGTFLPDGRGVLVCTGTAGEGLFLWQPEQTADMKRIEACENSVHDVAFLPSGQALVSGLVPIEPGTQRFKPVAMLLSLPDFQAAAAVADWTTLGTHLRLTTDGKQVVVSGSGVAVFRLPEMQRVMAIQPEAVQTARPLMAEPADNGRLLVSAWTDHSLRILETDTGGEVHRMDATVPLTHLDVSVDERWAVTSCSALNKDDPQPGEFDCIIWRLPKLKELFTEQGLQAIAARQLAALSAFDPELSNLRDELQQLAQAAAPEHEAQMQDLNARYVVALRRDAQRLAPTEQRALLAESDMIATGSALPPVTVDASLPAALQRLRGIYRAQLAQLEVREQEARSKMVQQAEARLAALTEQRKRSGDRQGAARAVAVLADLMKSLNASAPATASEAPVDNSRPAGGAVRRPNRLCGIVTTQRAAKNTALPSQSADVGRVPGDLGPVVAIAGGRSHAFALQPNGAVRGWGVWSTAGQAVKVPDEVADVVQLASSRDAALALRADGQVVAWGASGEPRLWSPPAGKVAIDLCAGDDVGSYVVCSDGTIHPTGATRSGHPTELGPVARVVFSPDVSFLAILRDTTVASWQTTPPVTPVPAELRDVVHLSLSPRYAVALQRDGTLVGWGELAPNQRFRIRKFTGAFAVLADPMARVFPVHRGDHSWELVPNPSCDDSVAEDRVSFLEGRLRGCIDAVFTEEFVLGLKPQ